MYKVCSICRFQVIYWTDGFTTTFDALVSTNAQIPSTKFKGGWEDCLTIVPGSGQGSTINDLSCGNTQLILGFVCGYQLEDL